MIDLALLVAGGQVLKDAYAAFKKVQEIKQNSELYDLLEKVIALRSTLLEAKNEIVDLQTEIDELRKCKETEEQLVFDSKFGVFFMREDANRNAYCTKCWKKDKSLVPMRASDWGYVCSVCDAKYENPDYVYPSSTVSVRRLV